MLTFALGLTLGACDVGSFVCDFDEDCTNGSTPGVCQPDGWCSFEDPSCPSEQRYGVYADERVAGSCVTTSADDPERSVQGAGPDPDTGSEDPGDTTTDSCPVGTDGCPCDAGYTCDDGLACSPEDQCEPAPPCRSLDEEPDDDEATAITISDLECDDEAEVETLGTLQGPETDWYRFFGNDGVVFCSEQPRATVTADVEPDVCVFIECLQGNAIDIGCAEGSMAADSPEGRPGCCGVGEAQIDAYGCGFLAPKSADVFISVTTGEPACIDYDFVYSF